MQTVVWPDVEIYLTHTLNCGLNLSNQNVLLSRKDLVRQISLNAALYASTDHKCNNKIGLCSIFIYLTNYEIVIS